MSDDIKKMAEVGLCGTSVGVFCGAAVVVLSILGLVNVFPHIMMTVAVIAASASILFRGAAITAELHKILAKVGKGRIHHAEIGGGMTADVLAGVAGIALGVLALLGVKPLLLCSVALIVLGTGLAMGCGVLSRLNSIKIAASEEEHFVQRLAEEASSAAIGAILLVGLAAVVLGILSLIGIVKVELILIGLLAIGGVTLLAGSAFGAKLIEFLHH